MEQQWRHCILWAAISKVHLEVAQHGLPSLQKPSAASRMATNRHRNTWVHIVLWAAARRVYLGLAQGGCQHCRGQFALHDSHVIPPCRRLRLVGHCQGVGDDKHGALWQHHIRSCYLQAPSLKQSIRVHSARGKKMVEPLCLAYQSLQDHTRGCCPGWQPWHSGC